jgi:hypothetical protein
MPFPHAGGAWLSLFAGAIIARRAQTDETIDAALLWVLVADTDCVNGRPSYQGLVAMALPWEGTASTHDPVLLRLITSVADS